MKWIDKEGNISYYDWEDRPEHMVVRNHPMTVDNDGEYDLPLYDIPKNSPEAQAFIMAIDNSYMIEQWERSNATRNIILRVPPRGRARRWMWWRVRRGAIGRIYD
jgi:hypothetical protein